MPPSSLTDIGPACRHYDPRAGIVEGKDCDLGHNVRERVVEANNGSEIGIAYRLPCRPGPKCLLSCDDYNPWTADEIAARKEAMSRTMAALRAAMPRIALIRATMVEGRIQRQQFDCPFCGDKNTLHATCAVDVNNHLTAVCSSCGRGMIE